MKFFLKILSVLVVTVLVLPQVFALQIDDVDNPFDNPNQGINDVNNTVMDVWATVRTVVQILAVAAVVFAGVRYMFASADSKADIKKSMGILVVGAILVFASITIISFVVDSATDALS